MITEDLRTPKVSAWFLNRPGFGGDFLSWKDDLSCRSSSRGNSRSAVRLAIEHRGEHATEYAAIRSIVATQLPPGEDRLLVVGYPLNLATARDTTELVDDRGGRCMDVPAEQRKWDHQGLGFRDRDEARFDVKVSKRHLVTCRHL